MKQKIPQELLRRKFFGRAPRSWPSLQFSFPLFFVLSFLLSLSREKERNHIVFSRFHVKRMKRSKKVCLDFLSSFHLSSLPFPFPSPRVDKWRDTDSPQYSNFLFFVPSFSRFLGFPIFRFVFWGPHTEKRKLINSPQDKRRRRIRKFPKVSLRRKIFKKKPQFISSASSQETPEKETRSPQAYLSFMCFLLESHGLSRLSFSPFQRLQQISSSEMIQFGEKERAENR